MEWYRYLADFLSGAFLANAIPHFTNGISGNKFPTPFAKPPGKGLSSPTINVIWALFNLLVGYLLFKAGKVSTDNYTAGTFFLGVVSMSIMMSSHFRHKEKE